MNGNIRTKKQYGIAGSTGRFKRVSLRFFLVLVLLVLPACSSRPAGIVSSGPNSALQVSTTAQTLTVSFIDVGQGDAVLIRAPGNKNLLIDGGTKDGEEVVLSTLQDKGIKTLSIVATHEDADHISALPSVIRNFSVEKVYLPKMPTKATATMERFAQAMRDKGLTFSQAKSGVSIDMGPRVTALFVAPVKDRYDEDNNYSAVLKLSYGNTSFLFTGDAQTEAENDMIKSGQNLKATVLKVGHHGSASSTGDAFLRAVSPSFAVIEVGLNDYGHPSGKVLSRLQTAGVKIFRTDQQGSVTAISDGDTVTFRTEK